MNGILRIVIGSIWFLPFALSAQEEMPDTIEAGWQGKKVCEVLQEDEMVRMVRCVYPPGVGQDRHYHLGHMGLVVQAGTLKSTSENVTREGGKHGRGIFQ